jgi:hypothetical protein
LTRPPYASGHCLGALGILTLDGFPLAVGLPAAALAPTLVTSVASHAHLPPATHPTATDGHLRMWVVLSLAAGHPVGYGVEVSYDFGHSQHALSPCCVPTQGIDWLVGVYLCTWDLSGRTVCHTV